MPDSCFSAQLVSKNSLHRTTAAHLVVLFLAMEQIECVLLHDDELVEETLDDDIEMADVEPMDSGVGFQTAEAGPLADNATGGGGSVVGGFQEPSRGWSRELMPDNAIRGAKSKRKKKKRKSGSDTNITDINRFVIDTCRKLKEKKSYLVWTAVGCLGVSAVSGLLKEVEAIQCCGGQKTADGKRYRTGGGVLWNVLKAREPKVYKEIMAKGREFENQFRHPQHTKSSNKIHEAAEDSDASEKTLCMQPRHEASKSHEGRLSVQDRIRVPVTYEDLFEEGEIHGQD